MADVRTCRSQRVVDAKSIDSKRAFHDRGIAVDDCHLRTDARVRNNDIETAEIVDQVVDRFLDVLTICDIALPPWCFSAVRGDVGQQVRFQAGESHQGTALVETASKRRADPSRRAGDEDSSS
jgi:hypothetical protein